jgi:DNA polymerase-1
MVTAINLLGCNVTSTTEKVIAPFAKDHESIRKLLEVREVGKSVSTYGLTWLKNIHPIDGRVHTEYFTGGTVTGRFSSSNPNMQNLPVHGGFRECFIPEEDYVYISCDYSQQEYRLAGAVSGEPIIIDAYKNNSDMHTATAANFFDKPMNEVTKDERSWGKTRNFEIIYGTTEWGLSKSLKSTVKYAKDVLDKYWAGYPTLAKFKEAVEAKILELGYSCTPLGRRRYNLERPVFATPWELEMWKSQAKREGFNLIIQGGGADIMKIAMVNLYKNNIFGDKFRLLLQIHDELLVEVHKSIIEEAGQFLKKEMIEAEQVFLGEIPAVVEGFDQVKMRWTK